MSTLIYGRFNLDTNCHIIYWFANVITMLTRIKTLIFLRKIICLIIIFIQGMSNFLIAAFDLGRNWALLPAS